MEEDYKTKKNDFISQAFIEVFLYLSEDKKMENPDDIYLTVSIYQNPKTLDRFTILW